MLLEAVYARCGFYKDFCFFVKMWNVDCEKLNISDIQCFLVQWIDIEVRDRK